MKGVKEYWENRKRRVSKHFHVQQRKLKFQEKREKTKNKEGEPRGEDFLQIFVYLNLGKGEASFQLIVYI